jgi:hypothetical protein
LEEFCRQCDILIESIDTVPQLAALARRFVHAPFQIAVPGRRMLREGQAKKHCRKKTAKREIFLFSDIFVYAQQTGKHLVSAAEYSLVQFRVVAPDSEGAYLAFYTPKKSFVLEFPGKEQRVLWEDAIREAVAALGEAGTQGVWEAAPVWVPDSAIKICPKCGDKFGKAKRRHHCRRCGNIYCGDCLTNRIVLPNLGDKPVACCVTCFAKMKSM